MKKNLIASYSAVWGCNILWGVLGAFWDLLSGTDPFYILAHRIVWAALFSLILLLLAGKGREIKDALHCRDTLLRCACCGFFITVNWGMYIYAVTSGHTLDSSLGYFMQPVVVVLIGILFFHEKLRKLEKVTVFFAAASILFLLLRTGSVPWIALVLSVSFSLYGAVKKNLDLPPALSLLLETLCVMPFALIFIAWSHANGDPLAALPGWRLVLLPIGGIVTSVPLLLFAAGVRHIPYYLVGILFYLNPSIQFLMSIFFFRETLDPARHTAFIIIWIGILFTVADKALLGLHEKKKQA